MSEHDTTAERIAIRYGGFYYRGQGADIVVNNMAIEVETLYTVEDAEGQLRNYRFAVYVAGANAAATQKALNYYANSDIDVMDNIGSIIKESTR